MASSPIAALHAHDFPSAGTPDERLRFLVHFAVQAPSSHNSQPWLFHVGGGALDLIADRTRALAVVDPHDRELTISCGAALDHLVVAAAAFAHPAKVAILPEPSDPDVLARLRLDTTHRPPADEQTLLFQAISRRHTNRKRFEDRDVPSEVVALMVAAAAAEGARLTPLMSNDGRREAVRLVIEGDHLQFDDPSFRRELAVWLHPRRSGDGLSLPGAILPMAHFMVRSFDLGDRTAARDRHLMEGSPLLAVLGTAEDRDGDWIAAGRALSRVLLTAAAYGVSASFLNQPIEVAALRPRLADLVGDDGYPQILLRLGYGPDVPPSPRREVTQVITNEGGRGPTS